MNRHGSVAAQRRLLVVLTVVAACLGYYALRLRPSSARVRDMRLAAESARIQLEALEDAPTASPAVGAKQERDEQRAALERSSVAWVGWLESFASCGSSERLDEQRLRLSRLADECGLLIRSNLGCTEAERRGLASATGQEAAAPHARYIAALLDLSSSPSPALRRITFESDFQGLRRFLTSLRELPSRVVILGFEINALRTQAMPALRTELVIAY